MQGEEAEGVNAGQEEGGNQASNMDVEEGAGDA